MAQQLEEDPRMHCVVRLKSNNEPKTFVGSGVLYSVADIGDRIYLFTAAHCLFSDGDHFANMRESIIVDIFSPTENCYKEILVEDVSAKSVMRTKETNDIAIIVLNKTEVLAINNQLPNVNIVCSNEDVREIVVMGFPKANNGIKVLPSNALWNNRIIDTNQFYLESISDIDHYNMEGYSGGGLFLKNDTEIQLIGIFVRFLKEDKGRMIYGQYLNELNDLLTEKNLPNIRYGYIGAGGLSKTIVEHHIKKALANLGPNFTIRTNAHDAIDAVARNYNYRQKLFNAFNRWLNDLRFYNNETESDVGTIECEYLKLRDNANHLLQIDTNVSSRYNFSQFEKQLETIKEQIKELITKYQKLSTDTRKQENYLSRLYTLDNHCSQFSYIYDSCLIKLTNNPIVIIEGEAGCGKSHLLGDVAKSRIDEELPSILLLGRDVVKEKSIEDNIVSLLNLKCSFEQLIISLNRIGIEQNNRFLILIDAINETEGRHYWKNKLAGFIQSLSCYSGIGIVLTIRSTYLKDELPESYLQTDGPVYIFHHRGFRGRELEAIPKFCDYYKIAQPTLPILSPEYSNPLLLTISCIVAQNTSDRKFIMASSGVGSLFSNYRRQMDEKFGNKREGEYEGYKVVTKSIDAIIAYMFDNNTSKIEFSDCYNLLQENVGHHFTLLLKDLISDCILLKEQGHGEDSEREFVQFTYQRLSDYYLAEYILKDCHNAQDLQWKFSDNTFHAKLYGNYNINGIIEQLAILLPEKYDLEFWEVIDLTQVQLFKYPSQFLMDSLKWRNPSSVNKEKIRGFYDKYGLDPNEWFNTCVLLATIPQHPFNSDYLCALMKKIPMAKRDAILQPFFLYYYYYSDSDYSEQYIKGLLDWAWSYQVSLNTDDEVVRLAGQFLVWMLSSTINCLRDRVTKALVNLLQYHSSVLIRILQSFEDVDDIYIQERLYAVTYGCILRTKNAQDIRQIGQYVYENIFKDGTLPKHILWRDYACNSVDYAVKKGGLQNINLKLVYPPYNEQMPEIPSEEDIKQYKPTLDNKDDKDAVAQYYIWSSLIGDLSDFGRKIVDGKVSDFVFKEDGVDYKPNSWYIRQWIFNRVFQLGYDRNIHGEYDIKAKQIEYSGRKMENELGKVERIGKKYEWIGLYEILGCLADNYMIKCPWDTTKLMKYQGAWDNFLRNIDPVCVTKINEDTNDMQSIWQEYDTYSYWHLDGDNWLDTTADVIDIKNFLIRVDLQGREWLTIKDYQVCHEPKQLGQNMWHTNRYYIIYVDSFIIHSKDKEALIQKANGVNFLYTGHLLSKSTSLWHITREKYWSRGVQIEKTYTNNDWQEIFEGSGIKAKMIYESLNGHIEDDYSGTLANYYMPTEELCEALNLDYSIHDGDFIDSNNRLIATCNPKRAGHFLMSKDELMSVLKKNDYDIVWIVSMEKFYSMTSDKKDYRMTIPSGMFYFDNDCRLQGSMKIHSR